MKKDANFSWGQFYQQAALTRADPKSTKMTDDLNFFFTLLGSAHTKAACKMLVKLTPGRGQLRKIAPNCRGH